MRVALPALLILSFAAASCGKKIEKQAEAQIRVLGGAELKDDQVSIGEIKDIGDYAVADVTIKTAVRLKKENGDWVIEEISLGKGRWEKMDHLLGLLEEKRKETTVGRLNSLAAGIERYRAEKGQVPQVGNFVQLVDVLSPHYLSEIVRIDGWSKSFFYDANGESGYDLRSAGSDGVMRTSDDLVAGDL